MQEKRPHSHCEFKSFAHIVNQSHQLLRTVVMSEADELDSDLLSRVVQFIELEYELINGPYNISDVHPIREDVDTKRPNMFGSCTEIILIGVGYAVQLSFVFVESPFEYVSYLVVAALLNAPGR